MKRLNLSLALLIASLLPAAFAATPVNTPYEPQKVVVDMYFDEPAKMATALYWIRSIINPLSEEPYGYIPDEHDIKVVIHGTEIVTVAKKNEEKYKEIVSRMRYYDTFGVEFKVCGLAAQDYDYAAEDLQDFIDLVPSAMAEIVHWQNQGYALLTPHVYERTQSIQEIR